MADLTGLGQLLIGVAAILSVIINAIVNYRNEKNSKLRTEKLENKVQEVHTATNGLTIRLEEMARASGFKAGQEAAQDEAAKKDKGV